MKKAEEESLQQVKMVTCTFTGRCRQWGRMTNGLRMYDVKTNFCSPNYKISTAPYFKSVLQNRRRWHVVNTLFSSSTLPLTLDE